MSAGVLAKRSLLLAITGVSLYLLAPAVLEVFGAFDRLDDFNPLWWVAMVLLQLGSYASIWELQRISMRAEHRGPRSFGHDRVLGAGVRHPARPAAAGAAGGVVRGARRPRTEQGRADRRRP